MQEQSQKFSFSLIFEAQFFFWRLKFSCLRNPSYCISPFECKLAGIKVLKGEQELNKHEKVQNTEDRHQKIEIIPDMIE